MHIFLTIPSLAKKSGGPATVVQHLSEQLVAAGVSVTVLTVAAEVGQAQVLPRDPRVKVISLPGPGTGSRGTSYRSGVRHALEAGLVSAEKHIIHDFGIWQPTNHAVVSVSQELGIPLVCSTSGMLAPWALRHKAWKKRLGWWLYQRRDLSRATLLAATSEQETQDIRRLLPRKKIALVPNGVEIPIKAETLKPGMLTRENQKLRKQKAEIAGENADILKAESRQGTTDHGPRTAVFLGRIHPVKGLKNLVDAWYQVQPEGWRCVLAGPDEAGHQRELEALLRERKLENNFEFPGLLDDEKKWALLNTADLFVLPSFTENFGVAAAEALACGVPVIATKGTPWAELQRRRCGWWIDIGVEPLAVALREAIALSTEERQQMGQRGRRLVEEKYAWPRIAADMLSVYRWVLGKGGAPAFVSG